jgi:outer membrane protein OmpA-like peptidoglycan-associated protein
LAGQGCPDEDTDGDGILGESDGCPEKPEDKDNYQDEDGCPDEDNDGDGILDVNDRCPDEAEVINGVEDEDGCPDEGESKVKVTEEKIEILDRVYFDTSKATIKPRSFDVLNQVASVLKANKKTIIRVEVQGHTDDQGNSESNRELSQQRAEAVVDYLVSKGVSRETLEAKGYGEANPIKSNKTDQGRAMNRRVEFKILEQKK